VEITPPDPGAALTRLRWFVDRRVDRYARSRDFRATDGTSRLSPYLRFGLVSPRQVAAAVGRGPTGREGPSGPPEPPRRSAEHPRRAGNRETFVNELLWRDFYGYVLYQTFDPDGDYIRRWVPGLSKLQPPARYQEASPRRS
jgi:deoxyribodipyrimidine photo-lyase